MGTRADFYVGLGAEAEWIGSIAYDGYEISPEKPEHPAITAAKTDADFREAVRVFLAARDDATTPNQGWPWPWKTSQTSDCAYWFRDGVLYHQCYGEVYPDKRLLPWRKGPHSTEEIAAAPAIEYRDMSAVMNVTTGGRSGLLILGVSDA